MENISEGLSKKKTKRIRRGLVKTKRNYKKKNVLVNANNVETEEEKKEDEKGGFLENLFSWF
jgi:hypothetical protein